MNIAPRCQSGHTAGVVYVSGVAVSLDDVDLVFVSAAAAVVVGT